MLVCFIYQPCVFYTPAKAYELSSLNINCICNYFYLLQCQSSFNEQSVLVINSFGWKGWFLWQAGVRAILWGVFGAIEIIKSLQVEIVLIVWSHVIFCVSLWSFASRSFCNYLLGLILLCWSLFLQFSSLLVVFFGMPVYSFIFFSTKTWFFH